MEGPLPVPTHAAGPRPAPALLFVAATVSLLAALSPRDLWAPDEPRYGQVAHEMVESGDWLVPHLNGSAYPEKPPLVFWLQAASEHAAGGQSAVAARLPSALLAGLAVLLAARIARRWFDDRALGDTAGILFATMGLVLWNGSRGGLDLPMTAFALLAVDGGTAVVLDRSLGGALRLGLGLGLGLLTKGPHALYVPVGALVGGCLASHRMRRLLDPRILAGLVLATGVVLAWLLPALDHAGNELTATGDRYGQRLLGQIGSRLGGEGEPHDHGFAFLWPVLLAAALPWTPFVLLGGAGALKARVSRVEDRFGLGAALGGLLLPLVLLSVPASKRELYLIPLLPSAAALAAFALHRLDATRGVRLSVRGLAVVLALLAAGTAAAPLVAQHLPPRAALEAFAPSDLAAEPYPFVLLSAAALLAAGAIASFRVRDRPAGAARAAGIALGATFVLASHLLLQAADPAKSFSEAARIADREAPGAALYIIGTSDVTALWGFRRVRATVLGPHPPYRDVAGLLSPFAPPAIVLSKAKYWDERHERLGGSTDAGTLEALDRARVLWTRSVGGDAWHLVTNPGR